MEAVHKQKLGIADSDKVVTTGSKSEVRKGQDTDIWTYDIFDAGDVLIARAEVRDSMSIYPPFGKHLSCTKYALDGTELISA